MAEELSYHEKMAQEAQVRAKVLYDGRADPRGRILVEPGKRREVEDFAEQLKQVEPPEAAPQTVEYARMDASAMLARLSRGDNDVLEVLRSAILSQDMGTFVDALDAHKIGTKLDRTNLRRFVAKQDREAIAACLRMIARSTDERAFSQEATQVDVALEKANHTYPLMGNDRRVITSVFLRGNNVHDPAPFRRPPNSDRAPETCMAIEYGTAVEAWEKSSLFNVFIADGANAAMDMMSEAAGYGHLDGRVDGNFVNLSNVQFPGA